MKLVRFITEWRIIDAIAARLGSVTKLDKSWVNKAYNNKTIARKLIELNRQRTEAATIKAASNGAFCKVSLY